ncbi:ERF family protein [Streptococcus infantarius subsp. infantarius]|uniref:ERF family protein n=1 Tax=Streptococcus infantarius TaxID=102684 RepID=UPI001BDAD4D3|nr:ERF family protein [Streptococcus infantarius]MBT0903771.1 ERF family protein [Streptococcus infantarius subsp. infantarius]MBT0917684.1 ERF family protein [Streptococcus infantarius subsp. infantarius]
MKKSDSISELAKAFAKTQQEMKQPLKNAENPFFNSTYVPLENVAQSITDVATKNGLSYSQEPTVIDGVVSVTTLVMHSSGEWIEYEPLRLKPDKNNIQGCGSAITYAKRYALSAIFGITSDKDDDGNGAVNYEQVNNQRSQKRPAQKSELSAKANKLFSQLIDLGQTQEDIAVYVKGFMDRKGLEKSTEAKTAAMEQMKNDILKAKENR